MLEYFKKLTPGEVIQFKKFVASPYFNNNRKVTLLGNYLSSRYPDLTPEVLNGKVIYRFVFRNQKYNDTNYRKLVSDFNSVFKRFLTELEVEDSNQLRNYMLLKKYNKLKIIGKIKHIHKETIDADSKFFAKDLYYYINLFLTEDCYKTFTQYVSMKEKAITYERLSKFGDWLIIYIKLYLYHINFQFLNSRPLNSKANYSLQKEIYDLVESNIKEIKKNHPGIYFLYGLSRLKTDSSFFPEFEKYCNKNKKLLKEKFIGRYLDVYFDYYYNLYIKSSDDENLAKKVFRFLDKYYLKNDPGNEVLEDGYLPLTIMYAAVNTAVHLKKHDWAEKFIEKNVIYLPEVCRKEIYSLAMGRLQFTKKDYKSSLDWFSNISPKEIQNECNKRIYTTMIYYELKEFEGVNNQLINLITFRNNKKVSEIIVSILKAFLKNFNMLLKIRNMEKNKRREEIILFRDMLEKNNLFGTNKKWFMEKIGEL